MAVNNGKNVLITGAGRGIGYGVALALGDAGYNVGVHCNNSTEGAQKAVEHIRACGGKAELYKADLGKMDELYAMFDKFIADFGHIDVMINNSGITQYMSILEATPEHFDLLTNVDWRATYFLTQLAAKEMMKAPKNRFRCIVNIGSVSADYASINRGEYCLSKAAIAMSTKLFAVRLADEGICVYEIRPGVIKTDMTGTVSAKYDKMIAEGLTLQRRWGFPEDIGKAVAALVSGAFGYSTGQVVNVDGGLSILRF